jgi:hypothetical protein
MDSSSQPTLQDDRIEVERSTRPGPRHALALDLEPATAELIRCWLAGADLRLQLDPGSTDSLALILVEIAYPRCADRDRLQAITATWPDVPVVLLSPTFFADTPTRGEVARRFGVAATLATPLSRDRFLDAVNELIGSGQ